MTNNISGLAFAKSNCQNRMQRFLHSRFWFVLLLAWCWHAAHAEPSPVEINPIVNEITSIITARTHPYLSQPNFSNRVEDLDSLYKLNGYQLLWLGNAIAEKNNNDALFLLESAAASGLNPDFYDHRLLQQKLQSARSLDSDAYKNLALYDTAISISVLRFLHDLHYGRVNPHGINFNLQLREKKLADLPVLIKNNLASGTILQLPTLVEPKLKQYQKLKQALGSYRQLAGHPLSIQLVNDHPVRPGQVFSQLEELRNYLVFLGDLPDEPRPATSETTNLYKGKIVQAVKKFQHRHGILSDGVLGKTTVEAINTPFNQRVVQIELAMERLRWLPEFPPGRFIIVNIPAFQLWAFNDISQENEDVINMKVVVGKALENQTPVLMAQMSFIDFMPYWNVPDSIVKDEILPKWEKNHSYLEKEKMELVHNFGNKVKPVAFSKTSIDEVKQGLLKIRQRPGKKNPLGQVKFIFPNKDEVYLHGTSANSLFRRSRRDFSHGCVRVEKPELLADFALHNQGKWTKDVIREAMKSSKPERAILKQSIPVLFFYTTSFVDDQDRLVFYPDIYGQDVILKEALQKQEDLPDSSIFVSSPPMQAEAAK